MLKFLFVLPAALFFAFLPQETPTPAPMPADAATLTNPVTPTAESQARAAEVYRIDCAMCHGVNGNGKGEIVGDMKLKMNDLTDSSTLKDTPDGEIFYTIKNGKGKMPGEGDRGKDEGLWNLVILVRSFGKK
jgi:mono/diheme cytochrome c family protein